MYVEKKIPSLINNTHFKGEEFFYLQVSASFKIMRKDYAHICSIKIIIIFQVPESIAIFDTIEDSFHLLKVS